MFFKKCLHEWEKQSDVVMKSAHEVSLEKNTSPEVAGYYSIKNYFQQCHVLVLTCKKCGTVYKSVIYNPSN
jgi:hypothetical protein